MENTLGFPFLEVTGDLGVVTSTVYVGAYSHAYSFPESGNWSLGRFENPENRYIEKDLDRARAEVEKMCARFSIPIPEQDQCFLILDRQQAWEAAKSNEMKNYLYCRGGFPMSDLVFMKYGVPSRLFGFQVRVKDGEIRPKFSDLIPYRKYSYSVPELDFKLPFAKEEEEGDGPIVVESKPG